MLYKMNDEDLITELVTEVTNAIEGLPQASMERILEVRREILRRMAGGIW